MRRLSRHELRKHWLCVCAVALALYTLLPVRADDFYRLNALPAWLEVLMFLLSFPLGTLFMWCFYTGLGGVGERVLLWAMALAVGYVQWFHLAPALLARLRRPAADTPDIPLSIAPAHTVAPAPRPLADKHAPPVPPFDPHGHTPLERIINGESRRSGDFGF